MEVFQPNSEYPAPSQIPILLYFDVFELRGVSAKGFGKHSAAVRVDQGLTSAVALAYEHHHRTALTTLRLNSSYSHTMSERQPRLRRSTRQAAKIPTASVASAPGVAANSATGNDSSPLSKAKRKGQVQVDQEKWIRSLLQDPKSIITSIDISVRLSSSSRAFTGYLRSSRTAS